MGPVVGIGEAETERAIHAAVWIELLGGDRVEALRRLLVALFQLWPEPPRPQADRIGRKAHEAPILLDPKLKLRVELEDAQIDRHAEADAFRREPLVEAGEVWGARQRLARAIVALVFPSGPIDAQTIKQRAAVGREQIPAADCENEEKHQGAHVSVIRSHNSVRNQNTRAGARSDF